MKFLDNTGLQHLIDKIKGGKIGTKEYRYVTTTSGVFSFTIPDYTSDCKVEVYINGLRSALGYDYTLSSSGLITTLKSIDSGAEMLFFVSKMEV